MPSGSSPRICEYVKETGDSAFFDQVIPFADGGEGTVYEHLKRSLDFSAEQIGKTGICLGLRADWNDCLNLGGGESAMVSFLHHWALVNFIEAARFLGRDGGCRRNTPPWPRRSQAARRERCGTANGTCAASPRKGIKIGSHENEEGKIFLESNMPWAVVSGRRPARARARRCMDSVDKHLYSQYGIHLLWPAFSKPDDDIGYVTRVYKGIKENGAIFSHPNPLGRSSPNASSAAASGP